MKILQSWDDGVIDDVKIIEVLKEFNATGTFNINIALNKNRRSFGWKHENKDVWRLGLDEMTELYKGFEIASHSMTHPCLTQCTDEQLYYELTESRKVLQDMFQQPVNGFCYPFGDFDDRVKDFLKNSGYTHSRGIDKADNVFPPLDAFEFNPHCHFASENFWNEYQNAKQNGSAYFFFWGHSYEIMNNEMLKEFRNKIKTINEDNGTEWVNISELFN